MLIRTIRATASAAVAVLIGSTAVVLGGAAPASADAARGLPIKSFGDLVVDGARQRVFVSDPVGRRIVETTYAGTVVATSENIEARGLALAPGGGRLYAAVGSADHMGSGGSIVALAADSLTRAAEYPLGHAFPYDLDEADGRLWFSYADEASGFGDFGSLDITASEPVLKMEMVGGSLFQESVPKLAVARGSAHRVALANRWGVFEVYDVSSGKAVPTSASLNSPTSLGDDLDFTPDASRVITAGGSAKAEVLRLPNLEPAGSYVLGKTVNAVEVAADGMVAIGWTGRDRDVRVYRPGSTTPLRTYDFPDTLVDAALAWEPGGSRLFAVSQDAHGVHTLRVLTDPRKPQPALTLSGNGKTHAYGATVTFTAHLGRTYRNRVVEIWTDPYGADQPNRRVKRARVDGKGNLRAKVRLTRNTTVTAVYAGDARTAARTVRSNTYVKARVAVKVTGHYKTAKIGKVRYQYFRPHTPARVGVTLTPYPGRKAYLRVEYFAKGTWRLLTDDYRVVNTRGRATVVLNAKSPGGKMRVLAGYRSGSSGDSAHATAYSRYVYLVFKK